MKQPKYKSYQAKRAERLLAHQALPPMPWWWLNERDRIARYTMYIGFFTLALVLVTGALVWVGIQQWSSINGQLAEMKKTRIEIEEATRLDQRAWVGFQDSVSVPNTFTEKSIWQVNFVFFNSGKTPARATKIAFATFTSPNVVSGPSPEQIEALESKFQPTQAIAPQGKFTFAMGTSPDWSAVNPASEADLEALIAKYPLIMNGKEFLYYYGTLTYVDNSGYTRSTQFCIYMANPKIQGISFCTDFNDLT